MWHKPCRTFHPWCLCIKTRCLSDVDMGINSLRPRQNGRHFADDIFKCIFLNEIIWISIKISFVPKGQINNIPALIQIMAWRRPGDKPLSEPMMVSLLTHICVTRPQWVKQETIGGNNSHPSISLMVLTISKTSHECLNWYRRIIRVKSAQWNKETKKTRNDMHICMFCCAFSKKFIIINIKVFCCNYN